MSATIYARVADELKQAVDDHAAGGGMTLANAVADLLDRGLQATADQSSIGGLEQRAAALQAELETFQERERNLSAAYQGLAERTALRVGSCPSCSHPITGRDLLVSGRCPNPRCDDNLSALLGAAADPGRGSLDEGDFKLLLGALGLALAVAFFSQQGVGG